MTSCAECPAIGVELGGATYGGSMDGESSPARPCGRNMPEPGLDGLLTGRIDREQGLVDVQARLRALLRANQAVVGDLSLPVLLRRIVDAACELAGARYAALGIIDESGGLEQFVHAGVSEEIASGMDHLPEGKGLLGALIADPRPIRLNRIGGGSAVGGLPARASSDGRLPRRADPSSRRSVRQPLPDREHPRRVHGGGRGPGPGARPRRPGWRSRTPALYEESRRRQDWLQASTEVTQRLLSADGEEPLRLITRHAQRIADADIVTVVVPTPSGENVSVEVATRPGAEELTGRISPLAGILVKRVLATGQPVEVSDLEDGRGSLVALDDTATIGTVMALPLGGQGRLVGALVIGRVRGRRAFTPAELEMASTFAGHATVAMELADARVAQQRIARLEDRNRIARDLHDHVIQRLYAIGLTVQSVATGARPREASGRLDRVVTDLDETMRQIRASIFHLRGPLGPETGSVRAQLLRVVADVTPLLGFDAQVRFVGPVEGTVTDDLKDDLVAVLREALVNTARHAHADRVEVELTTSPTELSPRGHGRRRGNRRHRAPQRSGQPPAARRAARRLPGSSSRANQVRIPPAREGTRAAMDDTAAVTPAGAAAIRVFLLDDHEMVRRGVADLLSDEAGITVVGEAGTAAEARRRIPAARPDVAVLDTRLPDGSGIEVCRDLRSSAPEIRCLILTSYDDDDAVFAAVLAGAAGYLLKEIRGAPLVDAIRQVAGGRSLLDPAVTERLTSRLRDAVTEDPRLASLTDRERQVLTLIADGLSNREIAQRLTLSEKTVKNYVSGLFAKLGMQRRTQAAVYGADVRRE